MSGSASQRVRRGLVAVLVAGSLVVAAAPGVAEESDQRYEATEAGHPLKILYYITYPIGFLVNTLILKPAYWLGKQEPFKTVFGTEVDDGP